MKRGLEMDYISVKDAVVKWEISERRIQKLCEDNRIEGIQRFGRSWMIPKSAEKPTDQRKLRGTERGGTNEKQNR